jgi:hypothetical protein
MVAMFVDGSGQNEQSLERTFHRCFLPSFISFGWAVLEEKIKMWKVNGRQTTDAKWWQKLTLPLARWAKKHNYNYHNLILTEVVCCVLLFELFQPLCFSSYCKRNLFNHNNINFIPQTKRLTGIVHLIIILIHWENYWISLLLCELTIFNVQQKSPLGRICLTSPGRKFIRN